MPPSRPRVLLSSHASAAVFVVTKGGIHRQRVPTSTAAAFMIRPTAAAGASAARRAREAIRRCEGSVNTLWRRVAPRGVLVWPRTLPAYELPFGDAGILRAIA